jgi:hypothetical protein
VTVAQHAAAHGKVADVAILAADGRRAVRDRRPGHAARAAGDAARKSPASADAAAAPRRVVVGELGDLDSIRDGAARAPRARSRRGRARGARGPGSTSANVLSALGEMPNVTRGPDARQRGRRRRHAPSAGRRSDSPSATPWRGSRAAALATHVTTSAHALGVLPPDLDFPARRGRAARCS